MKWQSEVYASAPDINVEKQLYYSREVGTKFNYQIISE